jgi:hypothetical protein
MGFHLNVIFLLSLEMETDINDSIVVKLIEDSLLNKRFPDPNEFEDSIGAALVDYYTSGRMCGMNSNICHHGLLIFRNVKFLVKYVITFPRLNYNIIICYVFGKYYYITHRKNKTCHGCDYYGENQIYKYIPAGSTIYTIKNNKYLTRNNTNNSNDAYRIWRGIWESALIKEAIEKEEIIETEFSMDFLTNPPQAKYAGIKK